MAFGRVPEEERSPEAVPPGFNALAACGCMRSASTIATLAKGGCWWVLEVTDLINDGV
jgi:hypothetical protein